MDKNRANNIRTGILAIISGIKKGMRVDAIKGIRLMSGVSLKDAKHIADELWPILEGKYNRDPRKAHIGMRVSGECDVGNIVAMSPEWCVYRNDSGREFAEPWSVMVAVIDTPNKADGVDEGPEIPESEV